MPVRDPKTPSSKQQPDGAVAVLGRRADLGQPDQHAQPDVRREGPRLVHLARAPAGESGLLQEGLGPSVGEAVPDRTVQPPSVDVRSEDRQVHADQHVLPDASPGLRRGRQPHAVDERRRPAERRRRLAEPQDVRGDRRRGEVAGLDAARPRHQRQRQARRLRRAQPAGRSDQGQAHRGGLLRRRRESGRRHHLGLGARLPGLRHSPQPGTESAGDRARRSLRAAACRATGRAAWTSIATASSWASLASGHLASFDRRKCKGPLNGPERDRQALPRRLDALSVPRPAVRRT